VLAGVAIVAAGIVGWALDLQEALPVAVVVIALAVSFVPIAYSYYVYRSLEKPADAPA
jgi:hypothetical protein